MQSYLPSKQVHTGALHCLRSRICAPPSLPAPLPTRASPTSLVAILPLCGMRTIAALPQEERSVKPDEPRRSRDDNYPAGLVLRVLDTADTARHGDVRRQR